MQANSVWLVTKLAGIYTARVYLFDKNSVDSTGIFFTDASLEALRQRLPPSVKRIALSAPTLNPALPVGAVFVEGWF